MGCIDGRNYQALEPSTPNRFIGRNSAGRHKRIGEKLIGGEAAGSLEIPPRVADHQRVPTGINLRVREIALIFQHRVMD